MLVIQNYVVGERAIIRVVWHENVEVVHVVIDNESDAPSIVRRI